MIDGILSIIISVLIAAVVSCIVAKHERRRRETSWKWKVLHYDTRSSCLGGTTTLNFVYIITASCRHITYKTGN